MVIKSMQKMYRKKNCKRNLGEYHDLYVQNDTLLLADVFENFQTKCIEIYELDPANFSSAPGLAWQACLKKAEVELELLSHINTLLKVEKGIRGNAIHQYAAVNNKYMKHYVKDNKSSYIKYLEANNSSGGAIS